LLKTKQFKTDGKPGNKLRLRPVQVGDRIVGVVLKQTASGDALIESLRIGFEYRSRLPVTMKKYLNVTIHCSL